MTNGDEFELVGQHPLRLFPSALHPNRDGFKKYRAFSMLVKSNCAAVEAGSSALGANKDTRRRRGRAVCSELGRGVRLLEQGRKGRKADRWRCSNGSATRAEAAI